MTAWNVGSSNQNVSISNFFCLWWAHIMQFNKRNARSWNEKVSTFKIFCLRLTSCVLIKEMQYSGVKWFQTSKCFACGGLTLWFLIKEVSDHKIERFQPSNVSCVLLEEMPDPGMERFQPLKFFACGRLISIVLVKEMKDCGIKCNLGAGFRVEEEPLISAIIGHYYWALQPLKGHCLIDRCERATFEKKS